MRRRTVAAVVGSVLVHVGAAVVLSRPAPVRQRPAPMQLVAVTVIEVDEGAEKSARAALNTGAAQSAESRAAQPASEAPRALESRPAGSQGSSGAPARSDSRASPSASEAARAFESVRSPHAASRSAALAESRASGVETAQPGSPGTAPATGSSSDRRTSESTSAADQHVADGTTGLGEARPLEVTPGADVLGTESGESSAGVTLAPGEGDDEEDLAAETNRVKGRVDGWLKGGVRRARVANGLVHPAHDETRRVLAKAVDEVPDLIGLDDPKAVATAVRDAWQPGAERYGRTGAPYDTPPGWNPLLEAPESLASQARNGSVQMQNFLQFLTAGARLQEFADGRAGAALTTLVEVTRAPDGAPTSVRLAQASGVKRFDDWVLETATQTLKAQAADGGASPGGVTLWEFTGHVSFMKKKVGAPTLRDVAGQVPLFVLSALTGGRVPLALGRFDEVSGDVEVLDLSSPRYECTVRLLEAD